MFCTQGHQMVMREAKRPPYGKFWGCSHYPSCTETKSTEGELTTPPADPVLTLLQDQVKEALHQADKMGLLKKYKGPPGFLCKVLKLDLKANRHFLWKLSEEECHQVLKALGEE